MLRPSTSCTARTTASPPSPTRARSSSACARSRSRRSSILEIPGAGHAFDIVPSLRTGATVEAVADFLRALRASQSCEPASDRFRDATALTRLHRQNVARDRTHRFGCAAHRERAAGPLEHAEVVVPVTHRSDALARHVQELRDPGEPGPLVVAGRAHAHGVRPRAEWIHGHVDGIGQTLDQHVVCASHRDDVAEAEQHDRMIAGHVLDDGALDLLPRRGHEAEMLERRGLVDDLVGCDLQRGEPQLAQDGQRISPPWTREQLDARTTVRIARGSGRPHRREERRARVHAPREASTRSPSPSRASPRSPPHAPDGSPLRLADRSCRRPSTACRRGRAPGVGREVGSSNLGSHRPPRGQTRARRARADGARPALGRGSAPELQPPCDEHDGPARVGAHRSLARPASPVRLEWRSAVHAKFLGRDRRPPRRDLAE